MANEIQHQLSRLSKQAIKLLIESIGLRRKYRDCLLYTSSLYVDRDSNIVFKSAYIPTATLASSGGAKYSSNDGILEGQVSSSNYCLLYTSRCV